MLEVAGQYTPLKYRYQTAYCIHILHSGSVFPSFRWASIFFLEVQSLDDSQPPLSCLYDRSFALKCMFLRTFTKDANIGDSVWLRRFRLKPHIRPSCLLDRKRDKQGSHNASSFLGMLYKVIAAHRLAIFSCIDRHVSYIVN